MYDRSVRRGRRGRCGSLSLRSVTRESVLDLYRRGRLLEAEAACEQLLAAGDVSALTLRAEIRRAAGRTQAAIEDLEQYLRARPADASGWRRLGAALLGAGRGAQAVDSLRRAVELEPGAARSHNNLGHALLSAGRVREARACFERALELDARYAIALHNLGLALEQLDEAGPAQSAWRRALALDPSLVPARLSLGLALVAQRPSEALALFATVLERAPAQVTAWIGRGAALLALERAEEALVALDQALALAPDRADALNLRGGALTRLHRPQEALAVFDRLLAIDAGSIDAWCNRAVVQQHLGDEAGALASYRRALSIDPRCTRARSEWLAALIVPVPDSARDAIRSRLAFECALEEFERWLAAARPQARALDTLCEQPHFYLAYHEACNRALLTRYRTAIAAARVPAPAAAASGGRRSARGSGRQRIGIVSAHVYDHSVYNAITHGWLEQLDRRRFEITVFSLGRQADARTATARSLAEHFEAGERTRREWAECIADRAPDVLLYPEIGMDRMTLGLASQRLASRQLVAWGHPDTSGLPTLDGYLSAELLEPDDAEEHYSERLIRLPRLGVYCTRHPNATIARIERTAFGIPADCPLFVCAGTPVKYRPEDDRLLIEIARRVGRGVFVFFTAERAAESARLQARLAAGFARAGLDPSCWLHFIPWQPRARFLGLLREADVFLDTVGFSGFNTMMLAVEAQLPGVAYDGWLMRGRLASGIYRRLGLTELIASNRRAYVDIAVRLATSADLRRMVRAALRAEEHRLYEDRGVIEALTEVLLDTAAR